MTRTAHEVLRDALGHLVLLAEHAEQDLESQLVIDAVCMRLSAAIDALASLDLVLRERLFGPDWAPMWGMRNRIAHGYLLVDPEIVRATVRRDVPLITARVRDALDR